ncbi:MAG: hypothetical protein V3T61_07905, partial [Acidobacteriota bacterium]
EAPPPQEADSSIASAVIVRRSFFAILPYLKLEVYPFPQRETSVYIKKISPSNNALSVNLKGN